MLRNNFIQQLIHLRDIGQASRSYHGSRTRALASKTSPTLAMETFDGLYGNVYGKSWPSMRLALLSPKKQVAILNSFTDIEAVEGEMLELGALNINRYYKKHLRAYTLFKLRERIIENKKARKRELLAKENNVDVSSINIDDIEVSDISDSELKGAQTTDASDGGFSTAEDLQAMFSDRRVDDDERYFINQASTELSLDDFMPATELIAREEIPNDILYYEGFKDDLDTNIEFKEEPTWEPCDQLRVYSFPRNSWSRFESPSPVGPVNIFTHYMLDGASLLPVLALDVRPHDVCADFCAAPGGKSLAMLMTLRPDQLVCNDKSISRTTKMSRIFKQYLPDIKYTRSTLRITNHPAEKIIQPDTYDKILVDVPCSNDRHSLEALDNNIFKRARTQERLELPKCQSEILRAALKSLKPGGCVVYSTCTLSPIENDGVVQRSIIQLLEEEWPSKFVVMNLKEALRPLRGLYKFNTQLKYGQQVMPSLTCNYGPMYISKIKRAS